METFVMIRRLGIYVLFILVPGCSSSNQPARSVDHSVPLEASMQRVSRIAFVLTESNNISIPAIIDRRHSVNLMFHTGVDALFTDQGSDLSIERLEV